VQDNTGFVSLNIENISEDQFIGLTPLSLIGRDGGAANGELDPTTATEILNDPETYGADNQWRDLKTGGCPFVDRKYARKGQGVSFLVDTNKRRLTLICRCPDHQHDDSRKRHDASGNPFWVFHLTDEANPHRGKFPPFSHASDVEVVKVLLKTLYANALYDTEGYLRIYDDHVSPGRSKHSGKSSPTRGKWVRFNEAQIRSQIGNYLDGEWYTVHTKKGVTYKRFMLNHSRITSLYKTLTGFLKDRASSHGIAVSKFDNPPPHIPLKGCIYDLQTHLPVLPDSSRSRYFYSRAEQQLPISLWSSTETPPERFHGLLEAAWGEEPDYHERMSFFQEWVGVALAGEATQVETHVLLKGVAASGKSQVITVIEGLFGKDEVAHVSPTQLNANFGLDRLANVRLNTVAEIPCRGLTNSAMMKALQSGDSVTVDVKYKEGLSFRSQAAWLMGCNSSWTPDERDSSVFRRWRILTFNRPCPEDKRVRGLAAQIINEELRQIAKWAVDGYKRFVANGRRFTHVPSSDGAVEAWRADTDPVQVWLSDCIEIGQGEVSASAHYTAYRDWAKENGFKPVSSTRFGMDLKSAGIEKYRTRSGVMHRLKITYADGTPSGSSLDLDL